MSDRSKRILQAIRSANFSYGELEKATGIPKSALQRYATGQTEKIPLDRLEKIARATGVSPEFLMGWDEDTGLPTPVDETIETYLLLNDRGKALVRDYVNDLASKTKYTVSDIAVMPIVARGTQRDDHLISKTDIKRADEHIKHMPKPLGDKEF